MSWRHLYAIRVGHVSYKRGDESSGSKRWEMSSLADCKRWEMSSLADCKRWEMSSLADCKRCEMSSLTE